MESRFNDRLAHRRSPDSKLFISLSLSFFACRYEGEEREVTDKMTEIIFQSSSFVYRDDRSPAVGFFFIALVSLRMPSDLPV